MPVGTTTEGAASPPASAGKRNAAARTPSGAAPAAAAPAPRTSSGRPAKAEKKAEQSSLVRAYLIAFNVASACGWLWVNGLTASHFLGGGGIEGLYAAIALPLQIVQTAAIMEVLHPMLGLVRAQVFTTFVQGEEAAEAR